MVRTESKQLTFIKDDVSQNTSKEEVGVLNQFDKAKLQLNKYKEASLQYNQSKYDLDYKEAELLITTNWGDALPEHKRPTVGDKEAWIKLQVNVEKRELAELRIKRDYLKELFELEKEKYLKEDLDTKEEL